MITLRTMLDLQPKSFNKLSKIMYEYRLRKFVIKELTPAPLNKGSVRRSSDSPEGYLICPTPYSLE